MDDTHNELFEKMKELISSEQEGDINLARLRVPQKRKESRLIGALRPEDKRIMNELSRTTERGVIAHRYFKILKFLDNHRGMRYDYKKLYGLMKLNVIFVTFRKDINFLILHGLIPAWRVYDKELRDIDLRRKFILDNMVPGRIYTSWELNKSLKEYPNTYSAFQDDIRALVNKGMIKAKVGIRGKKMHTLLIQKVI